MNRNRIGQLAQCVLALAINVVFPISGRADLSSSSETLNATFNIPQLPSGVYIDYSSTPLICGIPYHLVSTGTCSAPLVQTNLSSSSNNVGGPYELQFTDETATAIANASIAYEEAYAYQPNGVLEVVDSSGAPVQVDVSWSLTYSLSTTGTPAINGSSAYAALIVTTNGLGCLATFGNGCLLDQEYIAGSIANNATANGTLTGSFDVQVAANSEEGVGLIIVNDAIADGTAPEPAFGYMVGAGSLVLVLSQMLCDRARRSTQLS